ncbi:GNAT family N-acetyltransferase [Leptospira brenneri]|uniref:GNAT family N-acetyltransferase n=1 Tax=Leptospira brenneri TaxID=2023182 RepID=UPI000C2AC8CE|nr:GNAT family N-acetyltransferase [Leptospira brenneri]PJZ43639.1 hypothetical protein CH361_19400 [Leptospira brenneri]
MFKIEELSINAWPAIQTINHDGWIIRMANGYTKRANSINPIYKYYDNFYEKLAFCEEIFQKNSLPTIFKITSAKEHETIDIELEKLKYEKIDLTSVQIIKEILPQNILYNNIKVENKFNTNWIRNFMILNKISIQYFETILKMLNLINSEVIVVSKIISGEFIGCGFGVMENGYVGIFDLVIKENERKNGYATEIIKIILEEAFRKGIKKSYLQVVTTNSMAINLYAKLGYKEEYKYWYRRKDIKVPNGV